MLRSSDKRIFTSGYLKDMSGGRFDRVPSYLDVRSPPVTTNLQAWYDAADRGTITDAGGGAVSQWNDKSGSGFNLTQGAGGSRPVTGSRSQGGYNAVDFDGASHFMTSSLPSDDRTSTTFAVVLMDAAAGHMKVWAGSGGTGGNALRIKPDAGGTMTTDVSEVAELFASGIVPTGDACVLVQVLTDTTIEHRIHGYSTSVSDANTFTAGRTSTLGCRYDQTAQFWDGLICEILRYSATLTEAQIIATEEYLTHKWGVV